MAKQKTKTQRPKQEQKAEQKQEARQEPQHDIILKRIKELDRAVEANHFGLAETLHEAWENSYHKPWGYPDFTTWASNETRMGSRDAYYHVEVWKKVLDCEDALPRKDMQELGWSKLKAIAGIITKDNVQEWIERAKELSVRDLIDVVKTQKRIQKGLDPTPTVVVVKLKMQEPEARPFQDAMKACREMLETSDDTLALSHICMDWLESRGEDPELTSIDDIVKWMESIWDVKVTYEALETEATAPAEKEEDPEPELEPKAETQQTQEPPEPEEPQEPSEPEVEPATPGDKKKDITELLNV